MTNRSLHHRLSWASRNFHKVQIKVLHHGLFPLILKVNQLVWNKKNVEAIGVI